MNNNVSHSKLDPASRASTLRLLATGNSDVAEGTMRLFLVLCLLASLVLGGWQANAGSRSQVGFSLPAVVKVAAPKVPCLATATCSISMH